MNEAPTVQERYITADSGAEVVIAAGWVAQRDDHDLALMLWGVTHHGSTAKQIELAERLGNYLNARMARDRALKGDAWKIAKEMLSWYLHGVCNACDGRGYEVIQGTPSLSDKLCSHCHGTGKRPYPREAAHVWLAAELSRMTAIAAGELMKRLRREIEL